MRAGITLVIVLLAAYRTNADGPADSASMLQSAESLFHAGTYHESAAQYQKLIDLGFESPDLFLNLGNAHLLADELPQAILAYRRGLRQHPLHPQLWENLEAARDLVGYPDDALKYRPAGDDWPPWLPRPSPTALLQSALVIQAAAWLAVACWLVLRRRAVAIASIILFLAAAVAWGWWGYLDYRVALDQESRLVVVAVNGATLRRGNGSIYPRAQLPIVNRGMEARLLGERGGWVQLRFPDGSLGWLPRGAVLMD